ncbi:MAG: ComEA family DNA-binding protein [Bacillota bacterium]|nr:ComEA family DNA-binding protein [Bacillota bacterium]
MGRSFSLAILGVFLLGWITYQLWPRAQWLPERWPEEPTLEEPGETLPEPQDWAPFPYRRGAPLPPGALVVDVQGEVDRPGVYVLPPGSRWADALEAAGGITEKGERASLNQALPLRDGDLIWVPAKGEGGPPPVGGPGAKVNLNRASEAELQTLPHIGPVRAARIVGEREGKGPFKSLEDFARRVSGIGPKILEELRSLVEVP